MTKQPRQINIKVDTREKLPWTFDYFEDVTSVEHTKLDTGDYTMCGYEQIFCVDRKRSIEELAVNLGDPRFFREMERMANIPHSFLLLEFNYDAVLRFPQGSGIPLAKHNQIIMCGKLLFKKIAEVQINYNVHFIPFASTFGATSMCVTLMKRILEKYGGKSH